MGLEILEQVPHVEAIIVPTGGGGLLAGTAVAIKNLKPEVKIIGVEPEVIPSFSTALAQGKPVYVGAKATLADSVAVPQVSKNAFATAAPHVDQMLVVDEDAIATAILRLIEVEKVVTEGGGAVGLAAIAQGLCTDLIGKTVVVAIGGGNIDTTLLGRCLDRGLAVDNRLCRFVVRVTDRPGGIAELADLCAEMGVSIKDIFHERAWIRSDVHAIAVKCVVETRDADHSKQLEEKLLATYDHVVWGVKPVKGKAHELNLNKASC